MRTILLAAMLVLASATTGLAGGVPCNIFGGAGADCPNPIVEGVVDGQWIALVYQYGGGNGGANSISVVSVGSGGNGALTSTLGAINPTGEEGDRMSASFVGGKLWVQNAVYLHGEAHCCYTHVAVQQFGFHNKKLVVERVATVTSDATEAQIRAALAAAPPAAR
jgi:hypothetical protein